MENVRKVIVMSFHFSAMDTDDENESDMAFGWEENEKEKNGFVVGEQIEEEEILNVKVGEH